MNSHKTGDEPPLAVPGLEVRERIGQGGMGSVYKAYQTALDRVVALKTVRPELLTSDGLALFQSEARLLAKCNHANIVKILEFHPEQAVPYFLMEYVDGIPLDDALRGRAWVDRAQLLQEVAATVASAHEHGVVHGDLKPGNILVDRRSKPHVLDFGLARLASHVPVDDRVGGTLGYLAPEVLERHAAPSIASDIYALGVTLYVLLTGVLPYRNVEEARAGKMRLPMEHDSGIPEPLQRICLKAMDRQPEGRYQSAELMQRDLERFCRGQPVLVRPVAYLRELEGRAQNHLSEIQLWQQQGFIDQRARDLLVKPYGQVLDADSPWLSETRAMLTGPLFLRAGAWMLLVSALLWPAFYWEQLEPWMRLASAGSPTLLMAALGTVYVVTGNRRNALACLGSFTLLFLVFDVVVLSEFRWLEYLQPAEWELCGGNVHADRRGGEFLLSNTQICAAALTTTLCVALLLRLLRAPFFASWLVVACVGLVSAGLLLVGDKERVLHRQVAWVALHYLVFGAVFYYLAGCLERWANLRIARPFYFGAVAILLTSAVAMAAFGVEEWFEEPLKYDNEHLHLWLISYSGPLLLGAWLCERFGSEGQRALTWLYYLLVPLFVLVPLNLLFADRGVELFHLGTQPVRLYEAAIVFVCIALVVAGKYLRIDNFVLAGLWGSAIWVFRVAMRHFAGELAWPLAVALVGGVLVALGVWFSRRFEQRQRQPRHAGAAPDSQTELYRPPADTVKQSS